MMKLNQIKHATSILASPAYEQIEYLQSIGHFRDSEDPNDLDMWNVDELGLEFGDAELLIGGLLERGEINRRAAQSLLHLGKVISDMSGPEYTDLWTVKGLKSDSRWEMVRQEAERCLSILRKQHN